MSSTSDSLALPDAIRRDGFAVVEDCLPPHKLQTLEPLLSKSAHGICDLLSREAIRDLARSPEVRRLVEDVLGSSCFAVSGTYFNKTPDSNWKVPWHQDRMIKVRERQTFPGWGPWSSKAGIEHVQPPVLVMEGMLAVRVHLDDCNAENGALRVIPGSHCQGYLSAPDINTPGQVEPIICSVRRGGALLMRPLLLHASSTSRSLMKRRVIHLEYANGDLPHPFQWRDRIGLD